MPTQPTQPTQPTAPENHEADTSTAALRDSDNARKGGRGLGVWIAILVVAAVLLGLLWWWLAAR